MKIKYDKLHGKSKDLAAHIEQLQALAEEEKVTNSVALAHDRAEWEEVNFWPRYVTPDQLTPAQAAAMSYQVAIPELVDYCGDRPGFVIQANQPHHWNDNGLKEEWIVNKLEYHHLLRIKAVADGLAHWSGEIFGDITLIDKAPTK